MVYAEAGLMRMRTDYLQVQRLLQFAQPLSAYYAVPGLFNRKSQTGFISGIQLSGGRLGKLMKLNRTRA